MWIYRTSSSGEGGSRMAMRLLLAWLLSYTSALFKVKESFYAFQAKASVQIALLLPSFFSRHMRAVLFVRHSVVFAATFRKLLPSESNLLQNFYKSRIFLGPPVSVFSSLWCETQPGSPTIFHRRDRRATTICLIPDLTTSRVPPPSRLSKARRSGRYGAVTALQSNSRRHHQAENLQR